MKTTWCGPEDVCFTADTEEQAYKQAIAYWLNAGYVLGHPNGDAYAEELEHNLWIVKNPKEFLDDGKSLQEVLQESCAVYLTKKETIDV